MKEYAHKDAWKLFCWDKKKTEEKILWVLNQICGVLNYLLNLLEVYLKVFILEGKTFCMPSSYGVLITFK